MEYVQNQPQLFGFQSNARDRLLANPGKLHGNFSSPVYISVVTDTWRPDINGVALTCGKMVDGFAELGAQIQLVQPVIKDADCEPEYEVVSVVGIKLPFYREVTIGVSSKNLLKQNWRKKRPDMVLVITEGLLGRSAMNVAQSMNIPVISEYHTNFQQYTRHYGFGLLEAIINNHLRRFHNRSVTTLVPTDEIKQKLSNKGFKSLITVARGVDTQLFTPNRRSEKLRRQWNLDPDQLAVIYVGRIAPEKNIDLAIKSFRRLEKINSRARFILVGDGPSRQKIESDNPDFFFCGMQTNESLATHYASADLYLFPSITETFGNVLLEAMASGLPAVCFDYAAAKRHVRNHYNGRSIPLENEAAFIKAAIELSSNTVLRKSIGNYARTSILEHSWENVYRSYAGIIENILTRGKK